MLLGEILVTYHNPSRANTFGVDAVSVTRWSIIDNSGQVHEFNGNQVVGDMATLIRDRGVSRIEARLGK